MHTFDESEATQTSGREKAPWPMWAKVLIGIVVAGAGLVALFVGFIFSTMRGDAYDLAMARASSDPKVVAALGTPLDSDLFISGSVRSSDRGGVAELKIPVEGPKGTGVILVRAVEGGGYWGLSKMQVKVDKDRSVIEVPIGRAR